MNNFQGRVAVITGAASGIGRGLAHRCAAEGMKVVLADVEAPALSAVEAELAGQGAQVTSVVTDVAQAAAVERLAEAALAAFGAVHLLFNNAGVGIVRTVWESTIADWEWVLGVNLWGVIHGVRTFVPIMLAQNCECHIVNTASVAGLAVGPGLAAPYSVAKHGVVALSETLYYELAERTPLVKVSVLCPGWVDTRILEAERNRPPTWQNAADQSRVTSRDKAVVEATRRALRHGIAPEAVAEIVFQAIRKEQLYIMTHPEMTEWLRDQVAYRLAAENPPLSPA